MDHLMLYIKANMVSVCPFVRLSVWTKIGQCLEDSSSHCPFPMELIYLNYIKELCPSVRRSFRGRSAVTPLGDKTSFGPPFVFCVLELSRKSPCLWACFHSLSPLSVVSTKKGNFNTSQYEMLKLCQTAILSQPNPIG
jgi:hypothetical protein